MSNDVSRKSNFKCPNKVSIFRVNSHRVETAGDIFMRLSFWSFLFLLSNSICVYKSSQRSKKVRLQHFFTPDKSTVTSLVYKSQCLYVGLVSGSLAIYSRASGKAFSTMRRDKTKLESGLSTLIALLSCLDGCAVLCCTSLSILLCCLSSRSVWVSFWFCF